MNTLSVIPARKGSKRVPGKNKRPVLGVPLIEYSIRASLACSAIDITLISTDDEEIIELAGKYPEVVCLPRDPELASDTASSFDVLQSIYREFTEERGWRPDLIVLLQPTNPLRSKGMIDQALERLSQDMAASSLIGVREERFFTGQLQEGYWVPDYPEDTRSQDIPPAYIPTGNLYIYRCVETILKGDALGSKVMPWIEDDDLFVNIDYEKDFKMLEFVLSQEPAAYRHLVASD